MQILGDALEIDKGDVVSSDGTLCFGYLPAEILCEMFEQINFFGFSERASVSAGAYAPCPRQRSEASQCRKQEHDF